MALAAGCATSPADTTPVGPPPGLVQPEANTPFVLRPYTGTARADPRLAGLLARLRKAGAKALVTAEDEAGLGFVPGRGPLVELSDSLPSEPGVRVTIRLVDGIRRPVVSLATRPFLAEKLTPEEHGAAALAEAALIATFGEREPPEWVRVGVPIALVGGLPRLLHERALRGRAMMLAQLVPVLDETDPITAAMRITTLRRIGRGERPLALLLAEFVRGASHRKALRAIGVEDPAFLEAAFETDRKKAWEAIASPAVLAAISARAVLDSGSKQAPAAGKILSALRRQEEEAASRWARAELWVLRGQVLLAEGKPRDALAALDRALERPPDVIRLDHARALRAAAAKAVGPAGDEKPREPAPKPPVETPDDEPPPPKPR